jgi:hypothetical protein
MIVSKHPFQKRIFGLAILFFSLHYVFAQNHLSTSLQACGEVSTAFAFTVSQNQDVPLVGEWKLLKTALFIKEADTYRHVSDTIPATLYPYDIHVDLIFNSEGVCKVRTKDNAQQYAGAYKQEINLLTLYLTPLADVFEIEPGAKADAMTLVRSFQVADKDHSDLYIDYQIKLNYEKVTIP